MQPARYDASHGVWFLSAKWARVIVDTLVYLANAIRSQSFALSQRFDPTRTVWPYFMPLPPIGFRSSELFPLSKPQLLSKLVTLMPLSNIDCSVELPQPHNRWLLFSSEPLAWFEKKQETLGFRVLLRLSVRSYASVCYHSNAADALMTFFPFEVLLPER